jgi:hypothetical protein
MALGRVTHAVVYFRLQTQAEYALVSCPHGRLVLRRT